MNVVRQRQPSERERRPRGRQREATGHRSPLSREEVVRTALAIVDRDGLAVFSMRKLGAALGVDPMAAYYYFPNKAAVLDGIVEAVYAEIPLPADTDAPWDTRLTALFRAYRNALRAHPRALPVLSTHPPMSQTILRHSEAAGAILHGVGLTPLQAMQAIGCLGAYVVGVALAEVGLQPGDLPDPTETELLAFVAALPPDEFPILTTAFRAGMSYDDDASFENGLAILIAGLKAQYGVAATST